MMSPKDIRKIAKAEFDKLHLPPGEPHTMLAWHFWKRAFDIAWGRFQKEQTYDAGMLTDYVPGESSESTKLKKVAMIRREMSLAHGITIPVSELTSVWKVTGDETPLEIWELSERIKKGGNEKDRIAMLAEGFGRGIRKFPDKNDVKPNKE